ncbi:MAG: glycosyltransferase family 4 protein [Aquabacterium sp.]
MILFQSSTPDCTISMTRASRIVINGRFLSRPVTGVERFATEMLSALDRLISDGGAPLPPIEILLPPGCTPKVSFANMPYRTVGRRQGHGWEQLDLPRACGDALLVNLCNTGPAFRARQVVVIHDAAVFAVPRAYSFGFRWAYRLLHTCIALTAGHIWTVSEYSRRELQRYLPLRNKPVQVLPEGGEHVRRVRPDSAVLDRFGIGSRPYVLSVSSAQPAKNFGLLVRALEQTGDPGFDVVVAGGTNPAVFSESQGSLPPYFKHVGYVTDEELAALYQRATCFVFPSLYEGFGIPPLEAMALGCPVVASTAASIPEVCADAAQYFDPRDPSALLTALMAVMSDPHLRDQLKANAVRQGEYWTWTRAASSLARALQDAVAGSHSISKS